MNNIEEQARQLVNEAEKKLSPRGFFQSIFGYNRNRMDDAIECFQRAGNLFKLAKTWSPAGSAFKTAGDLHLEQNNRIEAANNYVLAAKCMEKYDVNNAINFFLSAVQIYLDLGKFVMAAKLHNSMAEVYEQNLELDKAVQHYEQAADYFKVEESYISAKKCLLKVAQYASSEFQDYDKAINIYQEIAFHDLKNPILLYSAKESLFKAVLCHLCVDVLNAKYALDSYLDKYPAFDTTREFGFLKNIIEHVEEQDEDAFTTAVKQYDGISRFDTWQTKILLKIKQQIKDQPDLL